MNLALADITFPLWLVVSQWTLLFALGVLVIVAYRQIGFMLKLKDMGTEREGLPLGEKAPVFDYTPVNWNTNTSVRFEPKDTWSLLLFADPGCVSCQSALLALEQLTPKTGRAMRVLVVTHVEPTQIAAIDEFRRTSLDIGSVSREVGDRLYRTYTTPFAYLIDPDGVIQAKSIATDEHAIRKLVHKVDRSATRVEFTAS